MESTRQDPDHQWAHQQIEAYRQVYHRYAKMAPTLQQVLEKAARQTAPLAIIQTRSKTIPSFAEKAIRKKKVGRYNDPLVRMTDLCGGRVITQTVAEVRTVCDFIDKHFVIDAEYSVDVSQRLKPSEFGYRSVQYIVQFKRDVFPTKEIPEEVYPDASNPMIAKIQVRTVLEHAWAGFTHDRVNTSAFTIPPKWERELAVLAGMLEQTDQSFSRIQSGLRTYAASYGAYLNEEELKDEIDILKSVLGCDPDNPDLAHRIGELAMERGDWQEAIEVFPGMWRPVTSPFCATWGSCFARLTQPTLMEKPINKGSATWKWPVPRLTGMRIPWPHWPAPGRSSTKGKRGITTARPSRWTPPIRMRSAITWSTRSSTSTTWRLPP